MTIYIAVLGYGTVGSGVIDVINMNAQEIFRNTGLNLKVKYILDFKKFDEDSIQKLITHNYEDILNDNDVSIVVEVMGGTTAAYNFVKQALQKGKSAVTSNKALMAAHGAELLKIAKDNHVNLLFEASVGGGIPIIRALQTSMSADRVYEIKGILNGTTNYILTKMSKESASFEEALSHAQQKGYAEKDPTDDVESFDASRKIAILLSMATSKQVEYTGVYTEGITKITKEDTQYAAKISASIKLLAEAKITTESIFASVKPVLVSNEHPLSNVNGVYNAVYVKGNAVGELMFYGKGAGKLTTASAVVADIIDAAKHLDKNIGYFWGSEKQSLADYTNEATRKLLRVAYTNNEKAKEICKNIFQVDTFITLESPSDEFAFLTNLEAQMEIDKKLQELITHETIKEIRNVITLD